MVAGKRPGIYLGGKSDAKDYDKLVRWNVTHILNMTPPKEASIQVSLFFVMIICCSGRGI